MFGKENLFNSIQNSYISLFSTKKPLVIRKNSSKTVSQTCFHPPDAPRLCSSSRFVVLAAQQNEGLHSAVNSPAVQTPKRQVTLFLEWTQKTIPEQRYIIICPYSRQTLKQFGFQTLLVEALAAVSMKQHSFTSLHQIPNASRCCKTLHRSA